MPYKVQLVMVGGLIVESWAPRLKVRYDVYVLLAAEDALQKMGVPERVRFASVWIMHGLRYSYLIRTYLGKVERNLPRFMENLWDADYVMFADGQLLIGKWKT